MCFEWDENKELINIYKHGIDFSTAALVFYDNDRIERYDSEHSFFEDRFSTIGLVLNCPMVLMVVYTIRGDYVRIISARQANRKEKEAYYGKKEY